MRPMERIPYEQMVAEFQRVLMATGVPAADAGKLARVFADNSRDGVPSHGLNRFPGFIRGVRDGGVDIGFRRTATACG